MSLSQISAVVIGSLNTDIAALDIDEFPRPGEHVYGKELKIGPGGKSRNIADMLGHLTGEGTVAMIGRTAQDAYGLWRLPLNALEQTGINTKFIAVEDLSKEKMPAVALIPVNKEGENQIIVLPGASSDFRSEDIDKAEKVFEVSAKNQGLLITTLECPARTIGYAIKKAAGLGLRVVFDPGGIQKGSNIDDILNLGIYLIKPNEHEIKIMTGIDVKGFSSAKKAANMLQNKGVENVLITLGKSGGFLFTSTAERHIKIPHVEAGTVRDETGCGDQTTAALSAYLLDGRNLEKAAEIAIIAGTLQFYKTGIQPVTKQELEEFISF